MRVVLMRHGATAGNAERRYVGRRTDEPLSAEGRAQCEWVGAFPSVGKVYVSPLRRARETAALCFPNAAVEVVDGLAEFDFGSFERRCADEMADDVAYRAWVDGGCVGRCPGGDSRASFLRRTGEALVGLLREAEACDEELVVVVAHGGTIMAALSELASHEATGDGYFEWQVGPCEGYVAEAVSTCGGVALRDVRHFERLVLPD